MSQPEVSYREQVVVRSNPTLHVWKDGYCVVDTVSVIHNAEVKFTTCNDGMTKGEVAVYVDGFPVIKYFIDHYSDSFTFRQGKSGSESDGFETGDPRNVCIFFDGRLVYRASGITEDINVEFSDYNGYGSTFIYSGRGSSNGFHGDGQTFLARVDARLVGRESGRICFELHVPD